MSWQMSFTGSKSGVKAAIAAYEAFTRPQVSDGELPPVSPEVAAELAFVDYVKSRAIELIDLLPSSHSGVYVNIAGQGEQIVIFNVEGRALTL